MVNTHSLSYALCAQPLNSLSSVQDYHKACRVWLDVATTKDGGISRMLSKRVIPDSCCAIHTSAWFAQRRETAVSSTPAADVCMCTCGT